MQGVELEDGEILNAAMVMSNADPKRTMLGLLGARHMEAETALRFRHLRARGTAAKLHLALDGLPAAPGLSSAQLGQRLLIAPGLDYLDRAFNPCKYGAFSPAPALEITLPTVHDPALAPAGQHVLSAMNCWCRRTSKPVSARAAATGTTASWRSTSS